MSKSLLSHVVAPLSHDCKVYEDRDSGLLLNLEQKVLSINEP